MRLDIYIQRSKIVPETRVLSRGAGEKLHKAMAKPIEASVLDCYMMLAVARCDSLLAHGMKTKEIVTVTAPSPIITSPATSHGNGTTHRV